MTIAYVAKTRGPIDTVVVLSPAAGTTAGTIIKINDVMGVPLDTTVENESVTLIVKGKIVVPKTTAAAIKAGERVSLNLTAAAVTTPGAQDDWYCGWATKAATQNATEVEVMWDGYADEQVPSAG